MKFATKDRIIVVLSTAKLNLAAVVPMLLEQTNHKIIIVTTKENVLNDSFIKVNIIEKEGEFSYNVKCLTTKKEYDLFLSSNNERVGIIGKESVLFEKAVTDSGFIFSACRVGTFSYIEKINSIYWDAQDIKVMEILDNDSTIAEIVEGKNTHKNLLIAPATVHCICLSNKEEDNQFFLTCGEDRDYYFSPKGTSFRNACNKKKMFESKYLLKFALTDEEYLFYKEVKVIDINAIHSLLCAFCYVGGINEGKDYKDVADSAMNERLEYEFAISVALYVHRKMYYDLVSSISEKHQIGALEYLYEEDAHAKKCQNFVSHLFEQNDIVGRGLNPDKKEEFKVKKRRHLDYITKCMETIHEPRAMWIQATLSEFNKIFVEQIQ